MSLGKRLKESRKNKRMTQEHVSKMIGIDFTTVSKHENDKSEPDNATLEKYSKLYGVNAHWLLYGEGSKDIINDQARNDVIEAYNRLPQDKKKLVDDIIRTLINED